MKIAQEDLPKFRRLMILDMKIIVPKPLTKEEKDEHGDLTVEFNSKYPDWQNKATNFITGEMRDVDHEGMAERI